MAKADDTIGDDVDDSLDSSDEAEEELSRDALLKLNPFQLPNFSKKKIRYMAAFDIEKWVSEFEGLTFATRSAPVEWDEALAIQHIFQEGCCNHKGKVTEQDIKALDQFRTKVQDLLADFKQPQSELTASSSFFVRLGPRSPKDAPMMVSEPWGISETRLRAKLQEAGADRLLAQKYAPCPPDPSEVLRKFQHVCYSLLCVSTADEAVSLMVSSSRVMEDISHTMDHGKAGWDLSVSARLWDREVMLEREFRTFVVGGQLVAISQYDDQLCYPFIVENPERIVATIIGGMDDVRCRLITAGLAAPNSAVVVDFVVVPSQDDCWATRVIELNPFGPMTGASLYYWTADRRVLQGGHDLFGDLDSCESTTPPGSIVMPDWVIERTIQEVPFRYLTKHRNDFSWEKLEAHWGDYVRLSS